MKSTMNFPYLRDVMSVSGLESTTALDIPAQKYYSRSTLAPTHDAVVKDGYSSYFQRFFVAFQNFP